MDDLPAVTAKAVAVAELGAWRDNAACAQTTWPAHLEPNWWPRQGDAHDRGVRQAISICRICPVQAECLIFALVHDRHRDRGILGGLTAKERTALKEQLRAAGQTIDIRTCPQCHTRFTSSKNARRDTLCSDRCRKAVKRKRDARRSLRLRLRKGS